MSKQAAWDEHQLVKRTGQRTALFAQLQTLASRISAAENIDAIMLDLSRDICRLFDCERLTLYAVSECRTMIESKIKTGMDSFKHFSLPITTSSIAGHVALTKRTFNIRDVYDQEELQRHSHELRFLDKVDQRTGFRSREMVTTPIVNARNGELLGVLQLINNRLGGAFPALIGDGARELARMLAVAFELRIDALVEVHTRFDMLILQGALSKAELELAKRTARRKELDLEDVLIDEFQVSMESLGAAYAQFYDVPYSPLPADRTSPPLHRNFKREYIEHNGWLVVAEEENTLTVVALDPDSLRSSRAVEAMFLGYAIRFQVSTRRQFRHAVERLYDTRADKEEEADADAALLVHVQRIVNAALANAAPELQASISLKQCEIVSVDARNRRINLQMDLKLS